MTDTHTATVRVDQLRRLLADALCTASEDDTLPWIYGVLLHTAPKGSGTVLVATSTDRFILGQGHVAATGALPEGLAPTQEVKRAVAVLGHELGDRMAELSVSDGLLRIKTVTMQVELDWRKSDRFPQIAHLFDTSQSADERHVVIAADKLAQIMEVAARRDDPRGQAIRIEPHGATRPVHIDIGVDYRALVMPMKDAAGRLPLFIPPTEQASAAAQDGGDR